MRWMRSEQTHGILLDASGNELEENPHQAVSALT